ALEKQVQFDEMDGVENQSVTLGEVQGAAGFLLVRGGKQFQDGDEGVVGTVQDFNMPLVRLFLQDERQGHRLKDSYSCWCGGRGLGRPALADGHVGLKTFVPGRRHFHEIDLLVDAGFVVNAMCRFHWSRIAAKSNGRRPCVTLTKAATV